MTNIDLDSGREGSGSGRTVGKKGGKEVADEERVAIERSLLISERQSEIERVLNKHDDYVRSTSHSHGNCLIHG
jgi:hypothetical protein